MTWEARALRHLARVRVSNVDKHSIEGQSQVRLCNYTDVYSNEIVTSSFPFMRATASTDQIKQFHLEVGDTVITKDSETAGDIGVPAFIESTAPDLVCGYHLAIIRPDPVVVEPRYLAWAMRSRSVAAQWEVLATGVTRVGLKQVDMRGVKVALPANLSSQAAIADFLDRETAQIDALIQKQHLLIDRLRERRVEVVRSAFLSTGDSATQSSATNPWLGHMPAHWRVHPLWSMFRREKRTGFIDEPMVSVFREHGVVFKDDHDNLNVTAENREIYQLVEPGWLVVNRMKAWQGSVGVSAIRGISSGHYVCFRPVHNANPRFLNWLFRSPQYKDGFAQYSRGVRPGQAEIDNALLRTFPVLLPPISEQGEIADRLDRETAKIDTLIAKAKRFIELARERRSALITAAVTGQIDITEAGEA